MYCPLSNAIEAGNLTAVRELLNAGADPNYAHYGNNMFKDSIDGDYDDALARDMIEALVKATPRSRKARPAAASDDWRSGNAAGEHAPPPAFAPRRWQRALRQCVRAYK